MDGGRDSGCWIIARRQHGLIARAQAIDRGLHPRVIGKRLESGEWQRVQPGVYRFAAAPQSYAQALMACRLWGGSDLAFSHGCAARLWKLPGFEQAPIELKAQRDGRQLKGVIAHMVRKLELRDVRVVQGMPVAAVATTVLDLCAGEADSRVENALDDALRRYLVWLPDLERLLEREGAKRTPGVQTLRRLINERKAQGKACQSTLERQLRDLIWSSTLPRPMPQFEVAIGGRFLGRVDFAYPELKIVIEADSFLHHFGGRESWEADLRRRNAMTAQGWEVLNYTKRQIEQRPDEVLAEIRHALQRRRSSDCNAASASAAH